MIKNEALKWLVENLATWPSKYKGITSHPNGWSWVSLQGDICLVRDIPTEMYVDCHIEQNEWLSYIGGDLGDLSRDETFAWLYEVFNVSPSNWPIPNKVTQCDAPCGWSWCIGNQGVVVLRNIMGQDQIYYADIDKWVKDNVPNTPTNDATKFDDDKPMMHLVPLISVEAVAKVMTFGAKKYAPNGWKSVPNAVDRYNSEMLRHMTAIQKGEVIDPDSGLPHCDHIACNAMFLSYFHNVGESNE